MHTAMCYTVWSEEIRCVCLLRYFVRERNNIEYYFQYLLTIFFPFSINLNVFVDIFVCEKVLNFCDIFLSENCVKFIRRPMHWKLK